MSNLYFPVILAGGSGTRLWPLSRKNYPKQFLRLQGESSLLQQTVQRAKPLAPERMLVVSNDAHYFLCQDQLLNDAARITYLLEPCARNTAPAIAAAAHYIKMLTNDNGIMIILPSDHWIGDNQAWQKSMLFGAELASHSKQMITFGIKPSSPKTGYGYIEGDILENGVSKVKSFREKPDIATAENFIAQGNYYWNSGMFVCSVNTYLEELQNYAPDIYSNSKLAVEKAHKHHNYVRLDLDAFSKCQNESIDYAIMEKTQCASLIPLDIPWSDLGCWTSVAEANKTQDENGNVIQGKAITKDSKNCLISSENTLVSTLGIQDQIIVVTDDAVLVADKKYSQQVKDIVNDLGSHQLTQEHQKVPRPWGYYEILAEEPTFKVKRLMVKPKAKLSLQMHQHRAEHWVIVSGTAEIVNGDKILELHTNQSTYIPPKTQHRLGNASNVPLFVIEVQSGNYLGEDDIIRFDDIYERVKLKEEKEEAV